MSKEEDKKREDYVSPRLKVVNFRTEQGYAASGGGSSTRSNFNIVLNYSSF